MSELAPHAVIHNARLAECKALRQQIRHARRALSDAEQQQAAAAASTRLLQWIDAHNAASQNHPIKHVALYFSCDGELNTAPLFAALWQRGIKTYLPVLHPFSHGQLLFLHYHQHSQMQRNRYGIPEPKLDIRQLLLPQQLDIIITPLVAFDDHGNRMGMGGGFYDRTLANPQVTATALGYAHECQHSEHIPLAPWDVPLPLIVTPTRLIDNR